MRTVLPALVVTCIALAVTPATPRAAEPVYRWVDADGVVHYTQVAPRDRPYERVAPGGRGPQTPPTLSNPRRSTASAEPATAPSADTGGDPVLSPGQQARQAALEEQAASRLAELEQTRRRNCELAREQFREFTTYARIRVRDADGNVRILSEEERARRIAEAEEAILLNCDDAG